MISKLIATTAIVLSAVSFSSSASAFAVSLDGLGMDVTYNISGQTASFLVTADFTGATDHWIGNTMDAFSLQVGKKDSLTGMSAILDTDTSGAWTGSFGKVNGNGCGANGAGNVCFSVTPGGEGGDGASLIAATKYFWTFDLSFADGADITQLLSGDGHSIKFLSLTQNKHGKWKTGSQLSEEGAFQAGCTDPLGCDPAVVAVPEPISLALLGAGLFGLGLARRGRSASL